ncbi:ribosome-associated ATPase/putative transporter RbbA [Rhodopila globiformis]|uniref:Multidrug ABC transporter ATP-binding protein n=1 Tax=Rhodopila globiformis TaxID=1071 RepID=A0A2S6MZV7_RHOGL|nr:ribosome-associated ATPase/putative transporter RbbA [Rhodopila globiformis]PPQ27901.1 multidrug ABC transporter ATP-binding protein [Rhodopila globiformis]
MTDAVATARDVWHRYGPRIALRGVSLTLHRGGMAGLIGPDGVGKSTLLGILAGAKRIQDGRVEVLGGDLGSARHRGLICPRIAYMPQGLGRNLYPDLSVAENITFFASLFGQGARERQRRMDELLAATGLAPFADRAARNLSGGMRQKLGLCCALIHDPDLLILDEPTTGVDPLARRQFWDLVDRLRAERPAMSVIVATAYMDEAERFEHLIAMHDGAILGSGTPAALRRDTGCDTLEESFIAMLPPVARAGRVRPDIPPRGDGSHEVAISAHGLTRRFGDFLAVDDVSFSIERGEIFGFLGSNGCGKTTTMKMLTGLLPPTAGQALLFGQEMDAAGMAMRFRVGYMSQSFSLYTELTVQQNLLLHARLYQLPEDRAHRRVDALVATFSLRDHLHVRAAALPLGIRQRLSLAVAVVHEPELLILDEPTSGVDPLARDRFWALLGDLSRRRDVTIFVSTHFMNEAARCDRVALMHAGRVLATGSPADLARQWNAATLEEAFIACLEAAGGERPAAEAPVLAAPVVAREPQHRWFSPRRMFAYTRRETLELLRDHIRLGFAVLGMALLFLVFGFGVNLDVNTVPFAVLDRDRTPESRAYVQAFSGSAYFAEHRPIASAQALHDRMATGELKLAIEIPPGFGRDVRRGRPAEIGAWIDGAMPFQAETTRGYLQGVHARFLQDLATARGKAATQPATIETRFRYNQSFNSINAMMPGNLALLLAMIPAILMALAVVREKELGSITNLYVTPVTRLEFILGKQLPYVALAMVSFAILVALATLVLGVPLKGSLAALTVGTLVYVFATTCYGLLVSTFSSTQIAALFGTAILTVVPAMQFSGIMSPVSSLTGMGAVMGRLFPMSYYLPISVGTFTKGLGFAELGTTMLELSLFFPALLMLAALLLRKQER